MSLDDKSTHYDAGGIEVLDVIRAKLTPEEYRGYLKGNAIKYLLRCNFKGDHDRDIEKAGNYTRWAGELGGDAEPECSTWFDNTGARSTNFARLVEVELSSGRTLQGRAGSFSWRLDSVGDPIKRYRLIG